MSSLNDISVAIGALQAQSAETTRQLSAIFKKLDHAEECAHETRGAVMTLSAQILAQENAVRALGAKIELDVMPTIAKIKKWEVQGMTLVGFIGVLSGGSGVVAALGLPKLWQWIAGS